MPELPEVETTLRGIRPWLGGQQIQAVVIHSRKLRWPIPRSLPRILEGQRIDGVARRGKYLLVHVATGTLIMHLGMSGSMRIADQGDPPDPYDRFELVLANKTCLRFRDPRRFGSVLWTTASAREHRLLRELGPEPLGPEFHGEYLYAVSRGRRAAIKVLLMNGRIVVGVGNIYASEALFRSGIHPRRAAQRIARKRCHRLAEAVRDVLNEAIRAGGTTLQDFRSAAGETGRFRNELRVYGRTGQPCAECATPIRRIVLGQRSTFYCPHCQH